MRATWTSNSRLLFFAVVAAAAAAAALVAGCAAKAKNVNPSFPLTVEQARADLARMAKDPRPLKRPIVILGGFIDPGLGGWAVGGELRHYLPRDAKIISVSFLFCDSFDACRRRVIDAVDRAFPTDDPEQTIEVDVIGLSMGGLVGRYAVAEMGPDSRGEGAPVDSPSSPLTPALSLKGGGGKRRLRAHTLFTASSPHRGAVRAEELPPMLHMQRDMTAGSDFYRALEKAESRGGLDYQLVPYVRLGDDVVGPQYAAPPGRIPWWLPNPPGEFSHVGAMTDPRILADVLRRLRGEKPWTSEPPAPLPNDANSNFATDEHR
jgi:hypothetical protein